MKNDMSVVLNDKFGFYQIKPSPTPKELDEYYNTNYYDYGTYATEYTDFELTQKVLPAYEIDYVLKGKRGRVLDIGCGEGFIINHLAQMGWEICGLDFSLDGVQRHFPDLVEKVIRGDIYKSLDNLIAKEEKFDVIICNNVLEHVIDPLSFLNSFKKLCNLETIIRIQVPNDFSWFQNALKRDGMINNEYWITPPAHLSYFNNESLHKVLSSYGYEIIDLLGDFPIELFLLNEKSNYNKDKAAGPFAHKARLYFDVNLFQASIDKYIAFRRGCGQSGVCRNLITYCRISK